jgi:O-methyltransferase
MKIAELRGAYLDLLRDCLTGLIYDDPPLDWSGEGLRPFDRKVREGGMDWPARAHSMIGQRRMLQLQRAAEFVIDNDIAGDFIETGAWRGGACRITERMYDIDGSGVFWQRGVA